MKQSNFFILAIICVTFFISSCNKEDKADKYDIVAKVQSGNDFNNEIDSVYGIYNYRQMLYYGKAKYINGGFSMNLNPIAPDHLYPITYLFSSDEYNISDKSAKIFIPDVFSAFKGKTMVGYLLLTKATVQDFYQGLFYSRGIIEFTYVDKDVTVSGSRISGSTKNTYNLQLKKGWNFTSKKTKVITATVAEYEWICPADISDYTWQYLPDKTPEIFPIKRPNTLESLIK